MQCDCNDGETRATRRSVSDTWPPSCCERGRFFFGLKGGPMMYTRIKIKAHERGLLFRENAFLAVLKPGVYWYFDPLL